MLTNEVAGRNATGARAAALVLAALAVIGFSGTTGAATIGGGGVRSDDCLGVFQTVATPPPNSRTIRCVDGDPSCDADGVVNGECAFAVGVCANSTAVPLCTPTSVASMQVLHSADNGDPLFDPNFQAMQSRIDDLDFPDATTDDCTPPTNITVKLVGPFSGNRCHSGRKRVQLVTRAPFANGHQRMDRDTLSLICQPAPTSCIPTSLYDGTFDRVQKQIFNQRCALSGCHDSQTRAASLLLEVGASYGDLINVTPTNASAQAAGWKRIVVLSPTMGDTDTSFLFHKVTGDLPDGGFGLRMPRNRKPLESPLIEILRLWIEAGAPQAGWVTGTDH